MVGVSDKLFLILLWMDWNWTAGAEENSGNDPGKIISVCPFGRQNVVQNNLFKIRTWRNDDE